MTPPWIVGPPFAILVIVGSYRVELIFTESVHIKGLIYGMEWFRKIRELMNNESIMVIRTY